MKNGYKGSDMANAAILIDCNYSVLWYTHITEKLQYFVPKKQCNIVYQFLLSFTFILYIDKKLLYTFILDLVDFYIRPCGMCENCIDEAFS